MNLPRHTLDRTGDVSTIPRSQIQLADFNPRVIDADEKRRLKRSLEANGLSECLIWNRTTGRLLSGHQRLSILDKSAPDGDWLVPVIIRELDEVQEKQLLVAMNNRKAQGRDDDYKLGLIFQTPNINIEACGFDLGQITAIMPDVTIPAVLAERATNSQKWKDEKTAKIAKEDAAVERIYTGQEQGDKTEAKILEQDDQFYACFIWKNFAGKMKMMEVLGVDPAEQFLQASVLEEVVGYAAAKGYVAQTADGVQE